MQGVLVMNADEIREEILHLRSLAALVGDMQANIKIEEMILELERRLRELSNGGHLLTTAKRTEETERPFLNALRFSPDPGNLSRCDEDSRHRGYA
jgi:hypothetical protein